LAYRSPGSSCSLAGQLKRFGRTDDLRELRKRHYLHRPDLERLERYLGGLEAKERPTAKDLMRQAVLSGDYDPTRKAIFFAELAVSSMGP
jgi:hypothetical protein